MRSSCGTVVVVAVALMVLQTSAQRIVTQPTAPPCSSEIECGSNCKVEKGSDGCPTCVCGPPTCENFACDPGYVCRLHEVQCFTTPCYPVPNCVSVQETTSPCPMYKCASYCVPKIASNGCQICDCLPSCQTVKCRDGYACEMQEQRCGQPSCTSSPVCVPTISCTEAPNTGRCDRLAIRWTYNSTTDTCQRIPYYGCTPSPNTFISPKACEDSCKTKEPICIALACAKNCFTLRRKNKCPKCFCPNPCKRMRCRAGYECQLRESPFFKETFLPFCAQKQPV